MATLIEKDINGALEVVGGFGPFQWTSAAAFCFMVIPVSFQVLIMYFLAAQSQWRCKWNSTLCTFNGTHDHTNSFRCTIPRSEWEFIEIKEFSIVTYFDIHCKDEWLLEICTSIFFVGAGIGGFLWGKLADSFGRKNVLFYSLLILISISAISTFVPGIYVFIICRFFTGLCYVGSLGQILVMSMELVETCRRSFAMNAIWVFYSLSLCLIALKAYFIRSWKTLSLVCSCPYLLVLFSYFHIPESVHWLLAKGKIDEAGHILDRIAKRNKCDNVLNSFPVEIIEKDNSNLPSSVLDLFYPFKAGLKTAIQAYAWFVTSMIYYGLSLAASDLGGSLYLNFALVSLMECPGHIIGAFISNKRGRKKTAMFPLFIAGILCIGIPHIPKKIKSISVILDMFGKTFITMCYSCIYLWSAELYPTNCRAKGIGFLQVFEMLGGVTVPFLVKAISTANDSFIIFGVSAIVGSGLMMFLPETKIG